MDFFIVPGDNEWNECHYFALDSNSDPVKDMWRGYFVGPDSPFRGFDRDLPSKGTTITAPAVKRQAEVPENFSFEIGDVLFLSINRVSVDQKEEWIGQEDANEEWVSSALADDRDCSIKSIVLFSQGSLVADFVETTMSAYFARCGDKPLLNVKGDTHPDQYCMNKNSDKDQFVLTVEAYKAAPIIVSVVESPNGDHYFHAVSALPGNGDGCPDALYSSPIVP